LFHRLNKRCGTQRRYVVIYTEKSVGDGTRVRNTYCDLRSVCRCELIIAFAYTVMDVKNM